MVTIRRTSTADDWYQAAALVHDHVDWMRAAIGLDLLAEQPGLAVELDDLAGYYSGVGRTMLIAVWRDVAVGSLALSCDAGDRAELKRMYVRPIARGRGVADALVDAAIGVALDHGCRAVWLETLRGAMDPAIAVYRRNGFDVVVDRPATMAIEGLVVMERPLLAAGRCA